MKPFFATLIILTSVPIWAGEFNFTAHKSLLSNQIEYITASMTMNNKSQECLVDTGARFTLGKVAVLENLEKIGEVPGGGLSNPNLPTDLVQTDLLLGSWTQVMATIGRSDRIPYPCLIGNDFFLKKVFEIDFQNTTFSEIEKLPEKTWPLNVYAQDLGGHFGFDVTVAGLSTKSLFDTGASHTVVDFSLVNNSASSFTFIQDLTATDGNNNKIKATLYRVSHFSFGDIEFKNIDVIAVDLSNLKSKLDEINVIVGLDLIQKMKWSFDTQQRLWSFEKD